VSGMYYFAFYDVERLRRSDMRSMGTLASMSRSKAECWAMILIMYILSVSYGPFTERTFQPTQQARHP
jgi:hypothetical protein